MLQNMRIGLKFNYRFAIVQAGFRKIKSLHSEGFKTKFLQLFINLLTATDKA